MKIDGNKGPEIQNSIVENYSLDEICEIAEEIIAKKSNPDISNDERSHNKKT